MFLYGFEITKEKYARKLERNIFKYFAKVDAQNYICKGYTQPLLACIHDRHSFVCSPFGYNGSYEYKGQTEITLHSTYGHFDTYKKMTIFGLPFMVKTDLSDDDAVLAAMTDIHFVESLINALA